MIVLAVAALLAAAPAPKHFTLQTPWPADRPCERAARILTWSSGAPDATWSSADGDLALLLPSEGSFTNGVDRVTPAMRALNVTAQPGFKLTLTVACAEMPGQISWSCDSRDCELSVTYPPVAAANRPQPLLLGPPLQRLAQLADKKATIPADPSFEAMARTLLAATADELRQACSTGHCAPMLTELADEAERLSALTGWKIGRGERKAVELPGRAPSKTGGRAVLRAPGASVELRCGQVDDASTCAVAFDRQGVTVVGGSGTQLKLGASDVVLDPNYLQLGERALELEGAR